MSDVGIGIPGIGGMGNIGSLVVAFADNRLRISLGQRLIELDTDQDVYAYEVLSSAPVKGHEHIVPCVWRLTDGTHWPGVTIISGEHSGLYIHTNAYGLPFIEDQ